jgi:phenylpyruvate tautomerase PptA (4-oxalocrotonate tautomerase family)
MPLVQVTSNLSLSDTEKNNALQTLSKAIAELLDKPESVVMTSWTTAKMIMAGTDDPTAFVDLRALRLPDDAPAKLSKELSERIGLIVDIRADRIFLNFSNIEPSNWGFDGKTFE